MDDDAYFDAVSAPNGESVIADPEAIELNRAFLRYTDEQGRGEVVAGRQRILFDDQRFVGNVGWRQNEQTFDAALARTSMGIDGLSLTYAYLWEIQRIFGDDGPSNRRDFDSNTHLLRVAYDVHPAFQPVAFVYLTDFDNSPGNSADTFGLRATGSHGLGEGLTARYQLSYALQTDGGSNAVDYEAHYALADATLVSGTWGALGAGFELLGSDDGTAVFVTPLATAHKFNGFADAFLNNGGASGLRDVYASYAPKLPLGLGGKLVYHYFEADHGGAELGHEFDAVLVRGFGKHVKVVGKFGYFDGSGSAAPPDTVRASLEANVTF